MFVQADNVEALIRTLCRAAGSDQREADMMARNLTRASLTGHDCHGVGTIPTYIPTALRGANGIPIDDRTWQELVETAATVGISADEMDRLAAA